MKKTILITLIIFSSLSPLFSWDEKKATSEIQLAQKKMSDLEYNFELKKFIPHDFYAEAVISLRKARLAMEKKDFENAYYHSSMAIVKTETTTVAALVRKTEEERKKLEIEFLRNNQQKEVKKEPVATEILEANLLLKGDLFRIVLPDKNIFRKRSYRLSSDGKDSLEKIIRVLEKFDNANVKIAGHSRHRDLRNYTKRKADFIKKFFIEAGINEGRITTVGAGNHEVMDTAIGFRRVDRVEILISGIKLD